MDQHTLPSDTWANAQDLIAAVEAAYPPAPPMPTSHRDPSPLPQFGTAPPVAQPGRPPMSQRATDASGVMLAAGATSVMIGGSASIVMLAAGQVAPVVVGLLVGAPVAFLGVLARVFKRAKETVEAAPPVIHQHYDGATVVQDHSSVTSTTRGVIAHTRNDVRK
ncbi:hypothetical protein AB0C77_28685 [Streptomyces sp. NPDC048629]|uniref:hypothetical protein n=1 Tax=Streptomyces sp. NPDC048629 TaxID=3154824 RepID=UPI0034387528